MPKTEAIGTIERLNGKRAMHDRLNRDSARRKMTAIHAHEEWGLAKESNWCKMATVSVAR